MRRAALSELAGLLGQGAVSVEPIGAVANMHCHTFFSYNAYGYSPSALAWLGKKNGYAAVGIVDFDVLDAVDEFLDACELLGIRGSAGIETRVFIPEFADREINSPGEPGVCYHMGIGFTSSRVPVEVAPALASMAQRAARRNREMLARLNDHLAPLSVDYDADVLPLTPAGNATERHMLAAIIATAVRQYGDPVQQAAFWGEKLNEPAEKITPLLPDYAKFSNLVRSKLMKRGGAGYVQPTPESFPTLAEFHRLIVACGALPCAAWLDGTSAGEADAGALLDFHISQGVVALNIIPDRNWNLPEGPARDLKIAKLHEIVRCAAERDLPLNVGTEMNSPGNRLIDDFAAEPVAPLTNAFMSGVYFICGHTAMQRSLGLGYQSAWAKQHLPQRQARNVFYESVGRLLEPGAVGMARLRSLAGAAPPADILRAIPAV